MDQDSDDWTHIYRTDRAVRAVLGGMISPLPLLSLLPAKREHAQAHSLTADVNEQGGRSLHYFCA
jgi:hypothetical protein